MGSSWQRLYVLLPDGRLWVGKNSWTGKKENRKLKSISGGFAPGSNWVEIAVIYKDAAAIQSDGTLWRIPNNSDIRQIGSDSDWKKIAAGGGVFLALKQNGTLWGWGHDYNKLLSENSTQPHGIEIPHPIRVGNDSDWVNVFVLDNQQAMGFKRDGSTWNWGSLSLEDGRRYEVRSVREKVRGRMEGTNWLAMDGIGQFTLGIRTDGSLWAVGEYIPSKIFKEDARPGLHPKAERVGAKSDWVALSGEWQLTALEADGTLWTWDFRHSGKRPSKYGDWLAATEYADLTWGLAKDGTLTCWNEFGMDWPDDNAPFMRRFFLGPTRRPVLSCNILDAR
jgi:alpha-tubulin suppressor-like RCC1 family protein